MERIQKADTLLLVCCLGFVFSVAWYFANRGSKFWQENWENHVDLLEDPVIGPLYKTVLHDEGMHPLRLFGAFRFSVSKINIILSLFVMLLFLGLLAKTLVGEYWLLFCVGGGGSARVWVNFAVVTLTVLAIICLCSKGLTKLHDATRPKRITSIERTTQLVS
jgi:hypothetical protein